MTTAEQVAPLDPSAAAPMRIGSRLIGAIAVGAALLSATATFLVLSGLTPIAPVHEVVVNLLLGDFADRAAAARHHRPGSLGGGAGAQARLCGLAAARADRRPVRRDGRGADRSCRRGRLDDARSRPRPVLLDPHPRHDRAVADRGRRLCQRACPVDPRRDHGDGLRPRPRQADVRPGQASNFQKFFTAQATARGLSAAH